MFKNDIFQSFNSPVIKMVVGSGIAVVTVATGGTALIGPALSGAVPSVISALLPSTATSVATQTIGACLSGAVGGAATTGTVAGAVAGGSSAVGVAGRRGQESYLSHDLSVCRGKPMGFFSRLATLQEGQTII